MDPLRARTELACVHVLDHALAQRADRNRTHWQLLSWMRLTTPRSSRQAAQVAIDDLYLGYRARGQAPRFSGLSRSDLVLWPTTSLTAEQQYTCFWGNSRHRTTHGAVPVCPPRPRSALHPGPPPQASLAAGAL